VFAVENALSGLAFAGPRELTGKKIESNVP